MKHTIRVPCPRCDGTGSIVDDRGVTIVCGGCVGLGYHHENAPAPACDVQTHELELPPVAT